jgi:hypothetical protein
MSRMLTLLASSAALRSQALRVRSSHDSGGSHGPVGGVGPSR